jgi:hypothetical protein
MSTVFQPDILMTMFFHKFTVSLPSLFIRAKKRSHACQRARVRYRCDAEAWVRHEWMSTVVINNDPPDPLSV